MEKETQISLTDLVEGALFAMQADSRSRRTHDYYRKLLLPFIKFARDQHWPEEAECINSILIRQFLHWVGTRRTSYQAGKGSQRVTSSRPSSAWAYYKAVRRLFNWAIEEHLLIVNPVSTIHFRAPASAPVFAYSVDEIKTNIILIRILVRFPLKHGCALSNSLRSYFRGEVKVAFVLTKHI